MSDLSEYLRRAAAPRAVVAAARLQWLQRWRAAGRRALRLRPRIELFFAFDDPYAAIALPGLIEIAQRRRARLTPHPLLERGIANDPAANARRLHAVEDGRRLARRFGKTLCRKEPLSAQDCAFLAAWTQAAGDDASALNFACAALEQLWFRSSGPVKQDDFQSLHARHLKDCASAPDEASLARNSARLLQKGHWESPAALVEGQWFLAHERLAQIDDHLERLGW